MTLAVPSREDSSRRRVVVLILVLAFVCALASRPLCAPRKVNAASSVAGQVVAYIVSAENDSTAEIPDEAFPDSRPVSHRWEWRIFDPASARDTLFLLLHTFPTRVRWDPEFRTVEYALGNRIERVAWRLGAKPQTEAMLPTYSCLCDFWSGGTGLWHVVMQRDAEYHPSPGYSNARQFITRWDRTREGTWRVVAADSAFDPYGGCEACASLTREIPRPRAVYAHALLDSMRIGYHSDSLLRQVEATDVDDAGALVWVRSSVGSDLGLEMRVVQGDETHALEPLVWADRQNDRRATVYDRGDSQDEALGQIAFQERNGFLLVAAEYSGAYPSVVHMRTGRVVFHVKRPSARAVWVRAPW